MNIIKLIKLTAAIAIILTTLKALIPDNPPESPRKYVTDAHFQQIARAHSELNTIMSKK